MVLDMSEPSVKERRSTRPTPEFDSIFLPTSSIFENVKVKQKITAVPAKRVKGPPKISELFKDELLDS